MSRRARRSGSDWPWVAGFGVVIAAIAAGLVLLSDPFGGGGAPCDKPLPPLGQSGQPSAAAFEQQYDTLGQIVAQVQAGDVPGAEQLFYQTVHGFVHGIDGPLRERDDALGRRMCETLLDVETQLDRGQAAASAGGLAELQGIIAQAAVAFGYERPG